MVLFRMVMLSLVMFIGVAASCNKNKSAEEAKPEESIEEIAPSSYSDDEAEDMEESGSDFEEESTEAEETADDAMPE